MTTEEPFKSLINFQTFCGKRAGNSEKSFLVNANDFLRSKFRLKKEKYPRRT